eukprot:364104-Chlamydomonas_euryale.AAC.4
MSTGLATGTGTHAAPSKALNPFKFCTPHKAPEIIPALCLTRGPLPPRAPHKQPPHEHASSIGGGTSQHPSQPMPPHPPASNTTNSTDASEATGGTDANKACMHACSMHAAAWR